MLEILRGVGGVEGDDSNLTDRGTLVALVGDFFPYCNISNKWDFCCSKFS